MHSNVGEVLVYWLRQLLELTGRLGRFLLGLLGGLALAVLTGILRCSSCHSGLLVGLGVFEGLHIVHVESSKGAVVSHMELVDRSLSLRLHFFVTKIFCVAH